MTGTYIYKAYIILGVVIGTSLPSVADDNVQNPSKFKYGYVIPHKDGSTQAHLVSRDGNLALGRYYVNLQNGTGQKVTYFADDLGFHTGVSYSSQNGKGSSKTQIAMGHKALAALGSPDAQSTSIFSNSPTLLFGKKLLKSAITTAIGKSGFPKLNYTPIPGGFYLTHEALGVPNATEHPNYDAGLTSQGFTPHEAKYSDGVSEIKTNTQTLYPTSENVKNEIKQLYIQSTTPSIKTYSSVPQQVSTFSEQTTQFPQQEHTTKLSSFVSNLNDVGYTNEKSIEKTNFADIDAQIISEVQKHAEQIILKDLQKSPNVNFQPNFGRFSSNTPQLTTVTMQPIVVTNLGEIGLNGIPSTTAAPVEKSNKDLQLESINAVRITGKNTDQLLEDSGYFRVSLSPSLTSSINVSQLPHQLIDVQSADRNSNSNNSTFCESNLCDKGDQIFTVDLNAQKDTEGQSTDIAAGTGTNKVTHTYYPQNKLHDERHYITTIDVQKAISLEMPQNEDGSIQLAQNFAFNKIKPYQKSQFSYQTTPQPISNLFSVTQGLFTPESNQNVSPSQKPYILNTVTGAPGLFDITPNQNLPILQGFNDISQAPNSGPQERIENNRLGYEDQLVAPAPPIFIPVGQTDDLRQVEKNIQELRQQILSNIDAQHEEEQRKQSLVEEERKQYFENLKKVEALKEQNSYNVQTNTIQAAAAPVSSESVSNVDLVAKTQYPAAQQIQYVPAQPAQYETAQPAQYETAQPAQYETAQPAQYETAQPAQYETAQPAQYEPVPQVDYDLPPETYQTEIKGYTHEVAVPQANVQSVNLEAYQKPVEPYNTQNVQLSNEDSYNIYENQNGNALPVDNNIQQSVPAYTTEKVQNYVSHITQSPVQQRYETSAVSENEDKPQIQQFAVGQLNSIPVNLAQPVLTQDNKMAVAKALLVNRIVPFDYSRLLQIKQPISLPQMYSLPLQTESKLLTPAVYQLPQQIPVPVQIPQYKFVAYPDVTPPSNKQYYSTLIQKLPNKLRVQPLKPSTPSEESQSEAVRNLLSQPQFHQTYIYPGISLNNRLHLRNIRKNQISNSDQVRSQSVRRGKSLKNLRIEYGFKPPLRPSVEFTEEVKPSIYGPSVKPE